MKSSSMMQMSPKVRSSLLSSPNFCKEAHSLPNVSQSSSTVSL
jgi:hypothetical protein